MTDPHVQGNERISETSSSLLRRVKDQDQGAWDRLVRLYGPLVYYWCRQSDLQAADAADVGQEVFQAVSRKIGEFRREAEGDTFRGWLRVITLNKIRDHLRKKQAEQPGVGGSEALTRLQEEAAAEQSSTAAAPGKEESAILYRRAVELIQDEFTERTRQAFWRVVMEDQAPADVAAELEMTVNAVYLAKAHVLRRLREEFQDLLDI